MKYRLLDFMVCPNCKQVLKLDKNQELQIENQEIITGKLFCLGCANSYRIIAGIPRLLAADIKVSFKSKDKDILLRQKTRESLE